MRRYPSPFYRFLTLCEENLLTKLCIFRYLHLFHMFHTNSAENEPMQFVNLYWPAVTSNVYGYLHVAVWTWAGLKRGNLWVDLGVGCDKFAILLGMNKRTEETVKEALVEDLVDCIWWFLTVCGKKSLNKLFDRVFFFLTRVPSFFLSLATPGEL